VHTAQTRRRLAFIIFIYHDGLNDSAQTIYSAKQTDQRGSYALSCSPFTIHVGVCHSLPTSDSERTFVTLNYSSTDLDIPESLYLVL